MFLTEFFNTPEGDSYAKSTSAPTVTETKRKITAKNDPCWKGYHMVGTKDKGSKTVPNCVPVSEQDSKMADIINARQLAKKAMRDVTHRTEYFDYLKHLRNKHGSDYSTHVHQEATKLDNLADTTNNIDTISVDVPLLIRLLEYAREDAQTDMDLHNVAERLIALSQESRTLTMDDYEEICPSKE